MTDSAYSYKERALKVLNRQKPDKVPWFGDLDYWATSLIIDGKKPVGFKTSNEYIDWHRDLGVGFYLQGYFPFKTIIENCEVKEWKEGNVRHKEIITPKGTLRETWKWTNVTYSEAPVEHLIKGVEDLAAYRYMHENTRYDIDYDRAYKRCEQVGDLGFVLAYLPKSPLMQMVALDAGIMNVMNIFMMDQDELSETVKVVKTSHDRAAQISVDSPSEILMIPENLSSEVVGPMLFHEYMKPYQFEWADKINNAGKISCVHMDGTLKGLLREEASVGFTFIEAMTPSPVGDLEIEEFASFSGNNEVVFWGGLPGACFTADWSDEDFDDFVKRVLKVMISEPRYVLGVADQVPPDALERRVRRVAELVEEFGVYG
jgi:uroporphyrinogen-III decarboxylase